MSITATELVARRPVRMKGQRVWKVYYERKNVLVGYIFQPDGEGAGYAYSVGPRGWSVGSQTHMSKERFKTIKGAKIALGGNL